MDLKCTAFDLAGRAINYDLVGVPGVCPRCHRAVHPQSSYFATFDSSNAVQGVFRCTHPKCEELFLAMYTPGTRGKFELKAVAPWKARPVEFPESVTKLSPTFVEIYAQAMAAERDQLGQLVGIGLRKALEFLIKDFAIAENPTKSAAILKTMLAPCIESFVSDSNVKECAKRATWLGNDETHYTRRWESKDVEDLKVLVKLTVNWIDSSIMTKRYLAEMEQGKPA